MSRQGYAFARDGGLFWNHKIVATNPASGLVHQRAFSPGRSDWFDIPQVHPVTTLTMNYTSLIMGVFGIAMTVAWFSEGRRLFSPPTYHEIGLTVMDGLSFSEGQEEETGEKRGGK
ncbi:hypothetical protein COL922a_012102 [Colletotrichum nupharicola]|nr:hypothetical protein COL922a_012102 [Colletotrichum nupharicola]